MAKMGYRSGQGLGRHNQGRVNPVEARVLPKGKSLDAVMELKNRKRLPNAFKLRRQRKKMLKNLSSRSTTEESGVFTFLDRVLTSEIRSAPSDPSPSPLDRFKEPQETVTESSLMLHAEVSHSSKQNFVFPTIRSDRPAERRAARLSPGDSSIGTTTEIQRVTVKRSEDGKTFVESLDF